MSTVAAGCLSALELVLSCLSSHLVGRQEETLPLLGPTPTPPSGAAAGPPHVREVACSRARRSPSGRCRNRPAATDLGQRLDFQLLPEHDPLREKGLGLEDCGTILIVDHDDASRVAAVQAAVRLGYDARPTPSADELLERLGSERPSLAIVEVELEGPVNGLEVMRQLHERFGADLPVILVSANRTDALDRTAGLMLGADDYLAKPLDSGELLARVRRSLRRVTPPKTNGNGHDDGATLSPREREILTLLAEGRTQSQIAATLVISSKTVATHIQHILAKLGVHTRAQAVSAAFQRGLVEPEVRAHVALAMPDIVLVD
ncbi:MAG TPA: response regulator transcription factor [Gaiellaceae bacterium]|nr:response regulator transcription factor [Gaiellaceae bacterium]